MNPRTANPPFATPSREEISKRAHELWLARNSPIGQDEEIWLEAERQLVTGSRRAEARPAPSKRPENGGREEPMIDEAELQARLDSVGRTAQNSPTSLDLT